MQRTSFVYQTSKYAPIFYRTTAHLKIHYMSIYFYLFLTITNFIGSNPNVLLFSREEQMKTYTSYLPLTLIRITFFKILLTNLCIQFGLRGDHFFPVIFAGVSMGYGAAMLAHGITGGHVVFKAAIVTAALLEGIMKKPLAVTLLFYTTPCLRHLLLFLHM